ncbi:hypothetical protein AH782_13060 [Salmonella enterica subsp. enterica]|nr:hypothetical protein [Salmonella enterica subsp. enterica serovar Rubislaw]EDK1586152.1 hypothetical protein [Salmonella enterica subsp. enterica serovar Rubislaw]
MGSRLLSPLWPTGLLDVTATAALLPAPSRRVSRTGYDLSLPDSILHAGDYPNVKFASGYCLSNDQLERKNLGMKQKPFSSRIAKVGHQRCDGQCH